MTSRDELPVIAAGLAGAATPHQSLLTGGPITLRVSSTSPGPLAALAAALSPYLRPTRADPHPAHFHGIEQISIHTDPTQAARLRQLAVRPGEGAHGVRLVRAGAGAGQQHREAFLLWQRATPHTSHLVLDHPGPATDRVLLRLVRGIAGRCLITAGWVPLHAAAALTHAGLIVLTGPSGAGKTTALLALLASRLGHAFVTNDKIYLTLSNNGVRAWALPTSLALRPETIAMFPNLSDLITQGALSHVDNHSGRVGADSRVLVPLRQLADAFGVPLHPGGPVAAIVDLSYHGPSQPSWWRPTGPTRAVDAVTRGYLGDWFIDEPHEHSRLPVGAALLRAAHHTTLRRIASAVPVIDLTAGSDTPLVLEAIVTDLTGPADQAEPATSP
ncbi:MAG: hypothetical protein ACRDRA_19975 [Pseudonocardiaceae bacterium]